MTAVIDRVDRSRCDATKHGNRSAYNHQNCRCDDARADAYRYRDELRARHLAAGRLTVKTAPALAGSVREKRAAAAAEPGMTPARPTVEMLRILAGLGYDWPFLASQLTCHGYVDAEGVMDLAYKRLGTYPVISTKVEQRVRALYRKLMFWTVPFGPVADEAMAEAVDAGWGVIDLVAIRRALVGASHKDPSWFESVPLTALERKAVIYSGEAWGVNTAIISRAGGHSGTTVVAALVAA